LGTKHADAARRADLAVTVHGAYRADDMLLRREAMEQMAAAFPQLKYLQVRRPESALGARERQLRPRRRNARAWFAPAAPCGQAACVRGAARGAVASGLNCRSLWYACAAPRVER
jgi:hypothetical protein